MSDVWWGGSVFISDTAEAEVAGSNLEFLGWLLLAALGALLVVALVAALRRRDIRRLQDPREDHVHHKRRGKEQSGTSHARSTNSKR